jgi:GTP cyclohydrolase I
MKRSTFVRDDLDLERVRRDLRTRLHYHTEADLEIPVMTGVLLINDFLTADGRQLLEGQIYSHGTDLTKVYRTGRAGFGQNELTIAAADEQIPMVGELRREMDAFLENIFELPISSHVYQVRELAPNSSGHPRHVDYAQGFDIHRSGDDSHAITSVSLSVPISWNNGTAPAFVLEDPAGNVVQDQPGSLALLGPKVFHSHPETSSLASPSLWLVTQVFFKIERKRPRGELGAKTDQAPSVARWAEEFIDDASAIAILEQSEDRIRRAYAELLNGYKVDPGAILNEVERVEGYNGVVVERDIDFTSICGHHFLPFFGKIDVAYLPGNIITGLGKLPRLVRAFSSRFQIQELLVKQIAEEIERSIGARGVYVQARAVHLCMHSRGPNCPRAETLCCYATGEFLEEAQQRRVMELLRCGS